MNFNILINNVDYTQFVPIPFDIQNTLDESLDVAFIKLCYLKQKKPFSPLDSVLIKIIDDFNNEKEFSFFISSDIVTEIISEKTFNHELSLIEQTKWLERFTGIVKTNTSMLVKDFLSVKKNIPFMINVENYEEEFSVLGQNKTTADFTTVPYADYLKTPYTQGILLVPSFNEVSEQIFNIPEENFIRVDILYEDEIFRTLEDTTSKPQIAISDKNGKWEIRYWFNYNDYGPSYLSITFGAYYFPDKIVDYSITDVVNNLLITTECLLEDETPRFKFNNEQALEYSTIVAPDFNLIGTLWEALSEIGSYIHGIPRLHNNIIYFDKLGSSNENDIDLSNYCSHTQQFDIEQFATAIDSTVDNIVNVDEKHQGSITTPFNNGFKTVRSEIGVVQLTNDNILIETREPIEEIISVECGYLSNNTLVGDITPYIFETAEYNALSSLGGEYPISKAFALEYTQGQKNIKGLNFKIPNVISSVFSRPAIINIIARKLNIPATNIANENLLKLQFRVKYIPIISTRIKQHKSSVEDITYVSNLDFNQSSNKINSVAYGENMKGTIAKLGNPEITKMFIFNNLNTIPKVGDLYNDDYYISVVKLEFYKELYKCQIALSKNFNKLNEYVGIKSQKRFYEISEKQSVDRYIIYEDFCVVSEYNNKIESDGKSLINESGISKFLKQFTQNPDTKIIDIVKCSGYSKIQKGLTQVVLPINSLGIGNALIFNFHYDDNYSAGNKRFTRNSTELQNQVSYTDVYGRVDSLALEFGTGNSGIINYSTAVDEGNILPRLNDDLNALTSFFQTNKNIVIKKDNRENIHFTYQINFITNSKNFILGSALTRKSTFVTSELLNCKLYILPNKINKFDNVIDLTNATLIETGDNNFTQENNGGFLSSNKSTVKGKAWVLVSGNELIIGQNKNIDENDEIPAVNFSFTHKII